MHKLNVQTATSTDKISLENFEKKVNIIIKTSEFRLTELFTDGAILTMHRFDEAVQV